MLEKEFIFSRVVYAEEVYQCFTNAFVEQFPVLNISIGKINFISFLRTIKISEQSAPPIIFLEVP